MSFKVFNALALVAMLIVVLGACAAPPPAAPVIQTVVVEKKVEVPKEVIQTVEVEKKVEVVKTVEVEKKVEVPVTVVPASECATKKDKYKICFANLTEDIVFTKLVREGIESAAKAAGNIELVLADNKLDGATALNNANSFITQGCNGVVEFQTDEKFGNVIMSKFRAQNIPVIAIDIPMPGATFFGADNYKAGLLAGEGLGKWVNENWGGSVDNILMLELPQSGPIPAARMQGMLEGLQNTITTKVPDAKVFHLDSKNTQEEARRVVGDTLPKIPPTAKHNVAMTINDGTALGTIAAFEAANRREDVKVIGQNADPSGWPEICKDDMVYYGSTAYFPEKYGDKIIPAMLDMLACKPVPPSIYVDHVLVTKANIEQIYPGACKQ